ncbi:MAG: YegS/Rv2252/BmrU family lipid kinase [Chitinophagaceae bacterium]|nr:YegS/Rv2252/BmrU family lipid kinase [Chitinophagaceae bacterium]
MNRRLLFFINPISGGKSKEKLEQTIADYCKNKGAYHEIVHTNIEGDYYYLPGKIKEEKISDVVICGGDGSIHSVVAFLLNTNVNIGVIPMGSGNGLARTARIPYAPLKALDVIFKGQARFVDAFRVNGILGCQITGLGFDGLIAAEFAKERKRGLPTYTKLAIKHFFGAKPFDFSVEWNDERFQLKAFILCVSNANQFGNNLKIAPKALLNDGRLDVVVLKKTSKISLLTSFVNHLLFGKKTDEEEVRKNIRNIAYFNVSKIRITNHEMAPFHIDGEPFLPEKEYVIEVVPNAYKLIQPAS